MKFRPLLAATPLLALTAAQGMPALDVRTDRPPLDYAVGEPIVFLASATENGEPAEAWLTYEIVRDGSAEKLHGSLHALPGAPAAVTNAMEEPGFLRITVAETTPDGAVVRRMGRSNHFTAAAGAAVDALKPVSEPDDFDAFWKSVVDEVAAVDLTKASIGPVPHAVQDGFSGRTVLWFSVPFGSDTNRAPATGYVSFPASADSDGGSALPLSVLFQGYGTGGQQPTRGFHAGDRITLDVNAHGFELGRDPAYYTQFMNSVSNGGEGGGYGFRTEENADPNTCYFRGMVARDLLALRLACEVLGLWDGKSIAVSGGSQGAFQSLAVAALHPSVTSVSIEVPWLCDLGGADVYGRLKGWLPRYQPSLRYFDSVNFGKRVKVPVSITRCGLADDTCPPAGITLLYNHLGGPKSIRYVQNSSHVDSGKVPDSVQQQSRSGGSADTPKE